MDIQLEASESITVSIKGKPNVVYHVSAASIKEMGKRITDGLSPEEVAFLRDKKKFFAVKHLRARTGKPFKDAKVIVDAYCTKNGCCAAWPMCNATHQTGIEGLDVKQLTLTPIGSKAMMFVYQGRITTEEAHKLQEWAGYPVETYGFFSYYTCDDATKWSSKSKQKEPKFK